MCEDGVLILQLDMTAIKIRLLIVVQFTGGNFVATSPNANVQRQAARALFALAGSEKNQRKFLKCKG